MPRGLFRNWRLRRRTIREVIETALVRPAGTASSPIAVLRAGYDIENFVFGGYNLANTLYANHMSFIKDLASEMGRGLKVSYSLRFF